MHGNVLINTQSGQTSNVPKCQIFLQLVSDETTRRELCSSFYKHAENSKRNNCTRWYLVDFSLSPFIPWKITGPIKPFQMTFLLCRWVCFFPENNTFCCIQLWKQLSELLLSNQIKSKQIYLEPKSQTLFAPEGFTHPVPKICFKLVFFSLWNMH